MGTLTVGLGEAEDFGRGVTLGEGFGLGAILSALKVILSSLLLTPVPQL